MINNIKEKTKYLLNSLGCDEEFYNDLWIYMKIDILRRNMKENQRIITESKNRKLDFSSMRNQNIKEEIKFYYIKQLMSEHMCPELNNLHSQVQKTIEFLSIKYFNEFNSLLDIDIEIIIDKYEKWLKRRSLRTKVVASKINKNIKKQKYIYESDYFKIIRRIYTFWKDENKNYFDKDKWIFSDLPFQVNQLKCSNNNSISFHKIKQPGIKRMIKKLCEYELKTGPAGTAIVRTYSLSYFSKFLSEHYININNLCELNKQIIQDYIIYLKIKSGLKSKTINSRICALNVLIDTARRMNWSDLMQNINIKYTELIKVTNKIVNPYTDEELKEINRVLTVIPLQIARLICIMEYTGIRVSEVCTLRVNDLRKDSKDEFYICYVQNKTKKNNIIPVSDISLEILQSAIITSNQYRKNNKYVFSLKDREIITPARIDATLKKASYELKLKDKSGNPFNITSHRFRATVATKYADIGIEPTAIAKLLGQSGLGSLKHYITIHNETVTEAIQPIIKKQNYMIANIGHIKDIPKNDTGNMAIPLPNGVCLKPETEGVCKHANVCYTCKMFRSSIKYIDVYKRHLSEAERNITIAKLNGYDRLLQINQDLRNSLIKIIKKLEKGNE
ncbi:hypothetical protein D4Z93_03115 [Clostridium fermenticellae]|uniref:Tyr recombinase domain-containing protein n=1 Tax=Clostridium fermenticellae TaxID=2068654 RepID=A0A386H1Q0_9CLOT|nr:tyrosine-type recombinase/integrase [Clostridium fermenticellae]AYD39584.1 hypothetical protein D4Z93_03115 [Clostridium fermenticellae]